MHYRRFRTSSIPLDPPAFEAWLRDRWTEKDEMLEAFLTEGRFPVGKGGVEWLETEVRTRGWWEWSVPFLPVVGMGTVVWGGLAFWKAVKGA